MVVGVGAWTLWVSPPSCVAQVPRPTAHAVAGCCNVWAPCFECLKAACRIHPVSFPSSRPLVCCVCHPLNYLLSVRLTFPNNAPMNERACASCVCRVSGVLGHLLVSWMCSLPPVASVRGRTPSWTWPKSHPGKDGRQILQGSEPGCPQAWPLVNANLK